MVSGTTVPKALTALRAVNAESWLRTRVVVGSRVASEAIAVANVAQVHVAQPCWTWAETEQAVRRACRPGAHAAASHAALRAAGGVRVFLHASVPLVGLAADNPARAAVADGTVDLEEAVLAVGSVAAIRQHANSVDLFVHGVMMKKRAQALALHDAMVSLSVVLSFLRKYAVFVVLRAYASVVE